MQGSSLSWSNGSWIYKNLCHQIDLSLQTLWFRIQLRRGELHTTLYDKVCLWLAAGRWCSGSPDTPVSPTNKTDRHDITEMLFKVPLNTIILAPYITYMLIIFDIVTRFYFIEDNFRFLDLCFVRTILKRYREYTNVLWH